MTESPWRIIRGEGIPLIATAIHDGHALRPEVAALTALDDASRRREEDPFTSHWVDVAPTQVIVKRSRFEVDLNRPREEAVYITPDDAWGLNLWKRKPSKELIARSLEVYDGFYSTMHQILSELIEQHGKVVVLDLHSYNHRRAGPNEPPADPELNPEVNMGTGSLNRDYWGPVVDEAMTALREYPFPDHQLDVRENIKFRGGNFVQWIHHTFPKTACGLAIEFKKTYMDEWTGWPNSGHIKVIRRALASAVYPIVEALGRV